jgi:hypothetical protein
MQTVTSEDIERRFPKKVAKKPDDLKIPTLGE